MTTRLTHVCFQGPVEVAVQSW